MIAQAFAMLALAGASLTSPVLEQRAKCTDQYRAAQLDGVASAFSDQTPGGTARFLQQLPLKPDSTLVLYINGAPGVTVAPDASTVRNFALGVRQVFYQVYPTSKPPTTNYANGTSHTELEISDSRSGVGATSHNKLARLYVRNSTTFSLVQWALSWGGHRYGWIQTGDASPDGPSVASGSSITACNDQGATRIDYVFFQSTSGDLVCGISAAERGFTAFYTLSQATPKNGTKLAAWYDDRNGIPRAVVYYQDDTEGILRFLQIR